MSFVLLFKTRTQSWSYQTKACLSLGSSVGRGEASRDHTVQCVDARLNCRECKPRGSQTRSASVASVLMSTQGGEVCGKCVGRGGCLVLPTHESHQRLPSSAASLPHQAPTVGSSITIGPRAVLSPPSSVAPLGQFSPHSSFPSSAERRAFVLRQDLFHSFHPPLP